ncbi:hypothetical protein EI555_005277, partial [Monodon monoceros]
MDDFQLMVLSNTAACFIKRQSNPHSSARDRRLPRKPSTITLEAGCSNGPSTEKGVHPWMHLEQVICGDSIVTTTISIMIITVNTVFFFIIIIVIAFSLHTLKYYAIGTCSVALSISIRPDITPHQPRLVPQPHHGPCIPSCDPEMHFPEATIVLFDLPLTRAGETRADQLKTNPRWVINSSTGHQCIHKPQFVIPTQTGTLSKLRGTGPQKAREFANLIFVMALMREPTKQLQTEVSGGKDTWLPPKAPGEAEGHSNEADDFLEDGIRSPAGFAAWRFDERFEEGGGIQGLALHILLTISLRDLAQLLGSWSLPQLIFLAKPGGPEVFTSPQTCKPDPGTDEVYQSHVQIPNSLQLPFTPTREGNVQAGRILLAEQGVTWRREAGPKVCEEKLAELSLRMQQVETTLNILDAKLSSIPELDDVIFEASPIRVTRITNETRSETTSEQSQNNLQDSGPRESEVTPENSSTVAKDIRYARYLRMAQLRRMLIKGVESLILSMNQPHFSLLKSNGVRRMILELDGDPSPGPFPGKFSFNIILSYGGARCDYEEDRGTETDQDSPPALGTREPRNRLELCRSPADTAVESPEFTFQWSPVEPTGVRVRLALKAQERPCDTDGFGDRHEKGQDVMTMTEEEPDGFMATGVALGRGVQGAVLRSPSVPSGDLTDLRPTRQERKPVNKATIKYCQEKTHMMSAMDRSFMDQSTLQKDEQLGLSFMDGHGYSPRGPCSLLGPHVTYDQEMTQGFPCITKGCGEEDRSTAGLAQGHLRQQLSAAEGGLQGQAGPRQLRGSGSFRLEERAGLMALPGWFHVMVSPVCTLTLCVLQDGLHPKCSHPGSLHLIPNPGSDAALGKGQKAPAPSESGGMMIEELIIGKPHLPPRGPEQSKRTSPAEPNIQATERGRNRKLSFRWAAVQILLPVTQGALILTVKSNCRMKKKKEEEEKKKKKETIVNSDDVGSQRQSTVVGSD